MANAAAVRERVRTNISLPSEIDFLTNLAEFMEFYELSLTDVKEIITDRIFLLKEN